MMSLTEIVRALLASGLTEKKLADLVGTSQPTIHRIKKGAIDPPDSVGQALRALHRSRRSLQANPPC